MIEFRCKTCSRAFRVRAEYAGKSDRWPQCKTVSVVPPADSRIRFRCPNCNQGMSVSKASANKTVKCPKCAATITVPAPAISKQHPNPTVELRFQEPPPKPAAGSQSSYNPDTLAAMYPHMLHKSSEEDERTGERRLPWIIDIFMYPFSTSCLIVLAIVFLVPFFIDVLSLMLGPFWFFLRIPGFVVELIIYGYLYWYIMECVVDSAHGGVRAPDLTSRAPSLGEIAWRFIRTLGCLAFFAAPVWFYYAHTGRTDAVFYGLVVYAALFFPMGLLAVAMFDSFTGLNPILLVGSLFSTFFYYLPLAFVSCALVLGIIFLRVPLGEHFLLGMALYPLRVYLLLVWAHLLGRFYWRCEEKLYWDA